MYTVSYVTVQSFIWCGSWLPTGIVHLRVCSGCLPIAPSQRVNSCSNPTIKRDDLVSWHSGFRIYVRWPSGFGSKF